MVDNSVESDMDDILLNFLFRPVVEILPDLL